VPTSRDKLRLTGTPPKAYVKTGDSGRKRLPYNCSDCGSPLFAAGEGADAEERSIRWGAIRQRRALAPTRQIWRRSAVPWLDQIRDLPSEETE
jgi:hypothetical protein